MTFNCIICYPSIRAGAGEDAKPPSPDKNTSSGRGSTCQESQVIQILCNPLNASQKIERIYEVLRNRCLIRPYADIEKGNIGQ